MEYLWTPWRYRYITQPTPDDRCIFCDALAMNDDQRSLIAYRGKKSFVILNRFPYTTGHVMVVPYDHVAELAGCDQEVLAELMQLSARVQAALASIYKPEGYNLGMNIGRCAGAGVSGHLHLHVLPRWTGDTNFMTVVGETRLEPEELDRTYQKLQNLLNAAH